MKKFKMLALGFPGVLLPGFVTTTFFVLCLLDAGTFNCGFARGVSGFAEPRLAIVDNDCGVRVPLGGVGGLPVEGFKGVSIEGDEFSRGLRNIAGLSAGHRHQLGFGRGRINDVNGCRYKDPNSPKKRLSYWKMLSGS